MDQAAGKVQGKFSDAKPTLGFHCHTRACARTAAKLDGPAKRLEFLDIVLGDRPPLTPAETLYQRILAGDADEAQATAEILLKERSLGIYYDAVVVKVMQLAAADAGRGAIDRDQLERADRTLRTLIEGQVGKKCS